MREFILAYKILNRGEVIRIGDAWVATDATTAKATLETSRKFIAEKESIDPSWVCVTSMMEYTNDN